MRINHTSVNGADGNVQAQQTRKSEKTNNSTAEGKSRTRVPAEIEGDARPEISGRARELATAKKAASDAPDVREAKIAALKERIAAGHYNVDPKAVADRLVDEHLSSGIG